MPTDRMTREVAWVAGLLFAGLFVLPASIYLVGRAVFGEYGGGGVGEFYAGLLGRFLNGEPAAWFLLLSPCLLWLLGRLTVAGFRWAGRSNPPAD